MTSAERALAYLSQTGRDQFTPAQRRRWDKKRYRELIAQDNSRRAS